MESELLDFITRDGVTLQYRRWLAGDERPCVVYLHGLESHIGWFFGMAEFLHAAGCNVYAFDRRGSGSNREQRSHLHSYHYLFDDIKVFLDLVRQSHPHSPLFLMGLCLGGKIAVNFCWQHPRAIDGLILLSPSIKHRLTFSLREKLTMFSCALFRPQRLFPIPIRADMFTANEQYREFIARDPLRLRRISSRYYLQIATMERNLKRIPRRLTVPLLVMLAGIDEIVDTEGTRQWCETVASMDKTIKVYPEYHHLLLFEKNAAEIMQYIWDWVKERAH